MKNIAIIILLFVSNILFSQEMCATPNNINAELEKMVNKKRMSYREDISKKSFCINIHFKIVRNTQGVGGINTNSLQRIIDELNLYYNRHNIYFNNIGFEYINDSRFVNLRDDNEAKILLGMRNRNDAINYYIVDSFGVYNGMALQIPSHSLVVIKDRVFTSTSSHEVGHCLGLYHTFETHFCQENINGSNCDTCGDKVCDTPADNRGGKNGGYDPDLTNIMSYYPFRDHFTQGQFNRMKHYILHTPLLQKVVSANCPYSNILEIQGSSIICDNTTQTYTIDNNDDNSIQWQLSSDIEEVSRTNNSITIKPKSGFNGLATLTASNGNSDTTKKIWVGKPKVNIKTYPHPYVADIRIESAVNGVSVEEQGISHNTVSWKNITTGKEYGSLHYFIHIYPNNNFETIRAIISNQCGSIEASTDVFRQCKNDNEYSFTNNGNSYSLYIKPITACLSNEFNSFSTRSVNDTGITIQISNAMGQIVLTTKNKEFSLAHLLSGTYYARVIKNGKVVHTQTLLKQ